MSGGVHYELYVRRRAFDPWVLDHASEDRQAILAAADEFLDARRAAAVRVVKEVFDPAEGLFKTVTLVQKGEIAAPKKASRPAEEQAPLCTGPNDLYTGHARERIGRLMEGVLRRRKITPWELLHRPDIAETLEASGVEVQGAVQRVAVPEAQARGESTHEMVRVFQRLADATLERLIRDGRRRAFPEVEPANFAVACGRMCDEPDRVYLLSGGVAAYLAQAPGWRAKTEALIAFLAAAPQVGRPRALACQVLQPPLAEMLGGAAPMSEILGVELDLGGQLAALVRLAARREVEQMAAFDAELARVLPPLDGPAQALAEMLDTPAFDAVRVSVGARILAELNGPRRLRPESAEGEIAILRALAAVLTAAVGRLLQAHDVQAAFVERSKRLVAPDFVALYLADRGGAAAEARALVRLCENLTGPINRRLGARWLSATVDSLRFEKETRHGPDAPGARLAALAGLQRSVVAAALPDPEAAAILKRLGEAGGWVEEEAKMVSALAKSNAAILTRLAALMRMASGEAAPLGPAADRARAEAMRLVRRPEIREALVRDPEAAVVLKALAAA